MFTYTKKLSEKTAADIVNQLRDKKMNKALELEYESLKKFNDDFDDQVLGNLLYI